MLLSIKEVPTRSIKDQKVSDEEIFFNITFADTSFLYKNWIIKSNMISHLSRKSMVITKGKCLTDIFR